MTAVALGVAADAVFGDPTDASHPVAWFGRLMSAVEARLWRDSTAAGALHAGVGVGVGLLAGRAVPVSVATYVAVAGRGLAVAAGEVERALAAGELDRARERLPSLCSRDASALDEKDLARAVVESVAENTVDAVVAPVFWATVAGGSGVLAHRAANTMDAMVGYRTERYERYGWASARLDDAMAWVPARLTAALVAGLRPAAAGDVWRAVRTQAPAHPSPNAGVAEAAFAAALGLRLGDRVHLGTGRPPDIADIPRAVRLSRDVTVAATTLSLLPSLPNWRTGAR